MSRDYQAADLPAVQRIWKECGWVDSEDEAKQIEPFLSDGVVRVEELAGEVECAVSTHRGVLAYDGADLDLLAVTSVTTSWVGRKQGLATKVTAEALAAGAAAGAEVAALGMFEKGFYDQLGFGTGAYEHQVRFDPASIDLPASYRPPIRLTADDCGDIAAAHRSRLRSHGGIAIDGDGFYQAEIGWTTPLLALGYRDDAGRLTHFVVGRPKGESGPYRINLISYETHQQLGELFAMLKSLGDQVRSMVVLEPPDLQVEEILRHPIRARISTKGSEFEATNRAMAWWQVRILDVAACVARRRWAGSPVHFNLTLTDPLGDVLGNSKDGVAGSYVVKIGDPSSAEAGNHDSLPTLHATVNAFSRLWIGAQTASMLRAIAGIDGPDELISSLDAAMQLPTPHPGLYF